MKKILFITTHNLAANPRLVKEIQLAVDNGFSVEVVCFVFRNWSFDANKILIEQFSSLGVQFHCIEAGREAKLNWLRSAIKEKYNRFIAGVFNLKGAGLSVAVSRRSILLQKAIQKIKSADLVIGHNPGALYPTFYASKKFNCKAGFDVEDYHPGEGNNPFLQKLTKQLMQELLPKMDYVSFASPLIKEEVKKDLGTEGKNWFTLLNYFPSMEFVAPAPIEGPLKLVWFSQNISFNRGLEQLIPVLKNNEQVELHLFGNCDEEFKIQWFLEINNIVLHSSLPQAQLHKQLANFDIGLALEPGKDLNNELAISNKMLAYFQAGLYILASNTKAQSRFMNEYTGHGNVTTLQPGELQIVIQKLVESKQQIRAMANHRFSNAQQFNWEAESPKLINQFNI